MIEFIVIASLVSSAAFRLTQEDQKLYFVRKWLDKIFKRKGVAHWTYYPLLYCPSCMASVWTVALYFILQTNISLVELIVCVPCVSLMNIFFHSSLQMIEFGNWFND